MGGAKHGCDHNLPVKSYCSAGVFVEGCGVWSAPPGKVAAPGGGRVFWSYIIDHAYFFLKSNLVPSLVHVNYAHS